MSKNFEEIFNLPPLEDDQDSADEYVSSAESAAREVTKIVKGLNTAEKIDHALTMVTGLDEHDIEMDGIASEALKAYKDLMSLGLNVSDAHSGRIFEAANSMLKIALEAKDAKATRKLKMVDLQLKKAKLEGTEEAASGPGIDRNDILRIIADKHSKESSDSDK